MPDTVLSLTSYYLISASQPFEGSFVIPIFLGEEIEAQTSGVFMHKILRLGSRRARNNT